MHSWLICSYKRVRQGTFHPSRATVKFKSATVLESSSVLKDSIGGPKNTYIRSVMRDDVDIMKFRPRKLHSFVVSEHQQDLSSNSNPTIKLKEVEFKLGLSAPITWMHTDQMMGGEIVPIYSEPKLELMVLEEDSPVPIVMVDQDTVFLRQLFSAQNRIWFDIFLNGQTTIHLRINKAAGVVGFPESHTSETTARACLRVLTEWISPKSTASDGRPSTFLPGPSAARTYLETFFFDKLKDFSAIQEFLQASIPKLDKENSSIERNPEWIPIQDGVQNMLAFVETVESTFQGFGALVNEGMYQGDPACQRYHRFKAVLQETPENPWVSKSYIGTQERMKGFQACFNLHKLLPWNFLEEICQILSAVNQNYPTFQLLPIRELALVVLLRSTLLASNSRRQLQQEPLCKVVTASLAANSRLTPNPSEMFKHLAFCRNYALMLDETDILRVWPRNKTATRTIDSSTELKQTFNPIHSRTVYMKGHTDRWLVLKSGVTSFKYHIVDMHRFLTVKSGTENSLKVVNYTNPVGTASDIGFGVCRDFLLQMFQLDQGGITHTAVILPLEAGQRIHQNLDLGSGAEKCLLKACHTSSLSNRFYLSFVRHPDTDPLEVSNSGWMIKLGCG